MPGEVSRGYDPCPLDGRITCDDVRALVEDSDKQWALVIAGSDEGTQFVTWGKSAENKVYVSDLSEYIARELCGDVPTTVYESFHAKIHAAKIKESYERLQAAARHALAELADNATVPQLVVDRLRKALEE